MGGDSKKSLLAGTYGVSEPAPLSGRARLSSVYRNSAAVLPWMLCAATLIAANPARAGGALPTNGQYVAGQGSITGTTNSVTVNQTTNHGIINWNSFSIGAGNQVQINNGQGATLNRVTGGNLSQIDGSLKATGSVYLINPQGIVIGQSGQVIANGSFVASTRDVSNNAFMSGVAFSASGSSSGSVINQGVITSNSGDAILVGASVTNAGTISAPNGTVGLAAGNEITLRPASGDARISVSGGTGSVTNSGNIRAAQAELNAAGGNVYAIVENNGGRISATGTQTINGHVWLTAGGTGTVTIAGAINAQNANGAGGNVTVRGYNINLPGSVNASANTANGVGGNVSVIATNNTSVTGTVRARGGASGQGGAIETSGHTLSFGGSSVDAGRGGNWLLDPYDLNVDANAASTIDGSLNAGTSVTLQTTATSANGPGNANSNGVGDINILSPISWNTAATFTLDAYHSINITAPITVQANGQVVLNTNQGGSGGDFSFGLGTTGFAGDIDYGSTNHGGTLTINGNAYMLLYSMNDVQNINNDVTYPASEITGKFALATSFDASAIANWVPLGSGANFVGTFEGLGHTISNLTVNGGSGPAGLFGASDGTIRDVGLVGGAVSGGQQVGALVGLLEISTTGVSSQGSIANSFATASVSGTNNVGGLVGEVYEAGAISNSYATGSVTSTGTTGNVGGLVGDLEYSSITNSYATGAVSAAQASEVGGLVGNVHNSGTVSNSYATGDVSGSSGVGGLVGFIDISSYITNTYATGSVTGNGEDLGGLVGYSSASISGSYATGSVSGTGGTSFPSNYVGGLVGQIYQAGAISHSHATGNVTATGSYVGGLLGGGYMGGEIGFSYATGAVRGNKDVGGLVGNYTDPTGPITNDYATGAASGTSFVGGLVGAASNATIQNSYATGAVSGGYDVGGLAGYAGSSSYITYTYSTGAVSGTHGFGGLVGENDSSSIGASYWDTQTSGQNGGIGVDPNNQSANISGMTTAELQGALPSNLLSPTWSTGPGLYPYLLWQYPSGTPQAVTGTAYADAGRTVLTGGSVSVFVNGAFATSGTGANGYYYTLFAPGTFSGTPTPVLAVETAVGNGAHLDTLTNVTTGFDIWNDMLIAPTSATTYSAATATTLRAQDASLIAQAIGSNPDPTVGLSNYYYLAAGNFTVDEPATLSNGLYLSTPGNVTIADALTLPGSNQILLNAGGNISVDANVDVTGAGAVSLTTGGALNFGLGASGFLGSIVFTGAEGLGQSLTINGTPYTLIFTMSELQNTNNNLNGTYALATPLDAATDPTTPASWIPIGTNGQGTVQNSGFAGTFEGLGNTISNLTVNLGYYSYAGVFGYSSGTIRDVGVVGGSVNGEAYVGGLVGYNVGTINTAYASAAVGGYSYVGGLSGGNNATITNAYATGAVTGGPDSSGIGGLIGTNNGTISNSYATGAVSGSYDLGGLAGSNNAAIIDAYATGAVSGTGGDVGGLVGFNRSTVTNSYSTGAVSGGYDVGGLVGQNVGTLTNSFYDVDQVLINGANALTAGGIYDAQYQDWIGHNLSLNIANYFEPPDTNGFYSLGSVQDFQNLLGFAEAGLQFKLTQNIDLGSAPGLFVPYFAGSLDGQGNTIANLTINQPNNGMLGLIGFLNQGTVSNIGAINVNVSGAHAIGGLIGYNDEGTISNAYATGAVAGGTNSSAIGGLIGWNYSYNGGAAASVSGTYFSGTVNAGDGSRSVGGLVGDDGQFGGTTSIVNSYSEGTVTAGVASSGIGGLAGTANGANSGHVVISGSYSIATVTAGGYGSRNTGGLVGNTIAVDRGSVLITNSYATGAVSGGDNVGGLVGNNDGTITSTYATGTVTGTGSSVGGLGGYNSGTIDSSYATGAVSSGGNVGGLVGENIGAISNSYSTGAVSASGRGSYGGLVGSIGSGTISNSFYDIDTVLINGSHMVTVGGLYDAQYQDWIGHGETLNITNYFGSPDANGYYSVSSVQDFQNLLGFSETPGVMFKLTQNIDLSGVPGFFVPYFAGAAFDGQGFTISNLAVTETGNSDIGLFGSVVNAALSNVTLANVSVSAGDVSGENVGGFVGLMNAGSIENVAVAGGTVNGYTNAGGLVGNNYAGNSGTGGISNSSASVTVSGASNIGGLVGANSAGGAISQSFAAGAVSGGAYTGGLVGYNASAIADSYATSPVSGSVFAGGLVGLNSGTISTSYATGSVTASGGYAGGLIGLNHNTITSSYWDTQTSGVTAGFGSDSNNQSGNVAGLTTAQFQSSTLATLDFDQAVWGTEPGLYPYLLWQFPGAAPQAISGFASNGAPGSQIAVYANGALLANGSALTGANGYFYLLEPSGTITGSTKLGATLASAGTESGLAYTDAPMLVSGNVVNFDVTSGSLSETTGDATLSALNADVVVPFGAAYSTLLADISNPVLSIRATNASGFTIDQSLTISGAGLTLDSAQGITFDAPVAISGGGEVVLITNDGGTGGDLSFGLGPTGFAGSLTFAVGTGEGIPGQSLAINGTSYTLLYSMGDVQNININPNQNYALATPLNAATDPTTPANWIPLGTDGNGNVVNAFTGTFEGLGNTISNLTVNIGANNYAGLFGYTVGTIRDIGIVGGSVTGGGYTGGLAGESSFGGTITNSSATGTVSASGSYVGGLAGRSYGSITNSFAAGNVSVSGGNYVGGLVGGNAGTLDSDSATGAVSTGNGEFVGGLAGLNEHVYNPSTSAYTAATISNSSASGAVSGFFAVGGLVGENFYGSISAGAAMGSVQGFDGTGGLVGNNVQGTISASYATGNINGFYYSGGLVGDNSSAITDSYATGSVSGSGPYNGGLVGYNTGSIATSFATGSVSGGYAGGLVGENQGAITSSYWDTDNNVSLQGIGYDSNNQSGNVTGLTTAQLSSALPAGFDPAVWGNVNNQTTPYLLSNLGPFLIGADNVDLFYPILNVNQLQAINGNLTGNYALINNIDASATASWNLGAGFIPLGTDGAGTVQNSGLGFAGIFDGLGFTISNLTVNNTGTHNYAGLFGLSSGTVRNVGLVGGSVTGGGYVGALAGENDGTISNSYATASVSGGYVIGGLVGLNTGTISTSYATGNVSVNGAYGGDVGGLVGQNTGGISASHAAGDASGGYNIGGLVGKNSGTIDSSYATGVVSVITSICGCGGGYGGGLVGRNDSGTISNSYATGAVSGDYLIGGLIGATESGSISNSYSTGAVTGNADVGGLIGGFESGTISNSFYDIDTVLIDGMHVVTTGGIYNAQYQDWISNNQTLNIANYFGSPDANGYYSVSSVQDFQNLLGFAETPGLIFKLTQDVDLSGAPGFYVPYFAGAAFDGHGFAVSNLYLSQPTSNVGLFGYVAGGTLQNLTLVNVGITGGYNVGGLAGNMAGGSVQNVSVNGGYVFGAVFVGGLVGRNSGSITGSNASANMQAGSIVGGLVGENVGGTISNSHAASTVSGGYSVGGLVGTNLSGTISNSYATATVGGYGGYAGGLVGLNAGTITDSYATGLVTLTAGCSCSGPDAAGGLVGVNTGSISASYASSAVGGNENAGGLVGINSGTLTDVYALGSVSGGYNSNVGGLVGSGTSGGSVTYAYASGFVSTAGGTSNSGGLVGSGDGTMTVSNAYWDEGSTGQASAGGGYTGAATAIGGTTGLNPYTASTYSALSDGNWLFVNGTRPMLAMEYSTTITNAHQLQLMATNRRANYTLAGDIDASGTNGANDVWSSAGFVPISLIGSLEGNGFTITGLYENYASSNAGTGLFSAVAAGATVDALVIAGADIVGGNFTGAVAGVNHGTIENVTVESNGGTATTVSGDGQVGGLAGDNFGTISNALSAATVSGSGEVGDIAGWNTSTGSISSSTASGGVTASASYAGGIAGFNDGTMIGDTAQGGVSGVNQIGGFVGWNDGTITNGAASGTVSGNFDVGGFVGTNGIRSGWTGSITGSSSSGAASGAQQVGGFAGWNSAAMSADNVYTASVSATISGAGGFVGYNAPGATISSSNVSGSDSTGTATTAGMVDASVGAGGFVGSNVGTLSNDTVTQLDVGDHAAHWVGGFAGWNTGNGSITGSTVTDTNVVGSYDVGGFDGFNQSTATDSISQSSSSATVSGAQQVGGFAGWNTGTMSEDNVYNASVSATSAGAGGFVGYNTATGTISDSSVTGNNQAGTSAGVGTVDAPVGAGGFAGSNLGSLSNDTVTQLDAGNAAAHWVGGFVGWNTGVGNIASGTVTDAQVIGNYDVGGFVGFNQSTAADSISQSSSSATVSGAQQVGGFVGWNSGTMSGDDAYSVSVSATLVGAGGFVGYNAAGATISDSTASGSNQAMTKLTAGTVDAPVGAGGFAGSNLGTLSNDTAIQLDVGDSAAHWVGGFVGWNTGAGTITNGNAATVDVVGNYDVGGFVGDNSASISGSTTQLSAIDVADPSLVASLTAGAEAGGFVGSNEAGATISGSEADAFGTGPITGTNRVGGFAGQNLGTLNGDVAGVDTVSGVAYVGGLVGWNQGSISGSVAEGAVFASNSQAGGLVGYNLAGATISQSFADEDVTATIEEAGGLVGVNMGSIDNSVAFSSVSNVYASGVFAGLNGGSISYSYSVGGGARAGFLGVNLATGTLSDDYWDITMSGVSVGINLDSNNQSGNVVPLTTAQLQAGLPPGFDPSIWGSDNNPNGAIFDGLPYLLVLFGPH